VTSPSWRAHFDVPADVAYLNTAYMGPLPREAAAAGREALDRKLRPWEIGPDDFFAPVAELRAVLAGLLGGDAAGVALTPAVSHGVATAATNVELGPGQRVVVLAEQFPSHVYAWRDRAAAVGAEVIAAPRPAAGDWTASVLDLLDERVAVVAVPPCHWTDGGVVDLEAVGAAARAVGAALVVDGTQWVGAAPLDVGRIRPDFVAGATYKWLLGPYSLAYLWAAPHRREGRPIEHNWIARAGSEDFAGLVDYRDDYQPGARRYDTGEVSNFALVPVALTSARLVADWGVEGLAAAARSRTDRIAAAATDLGLGVAATPHRAPHLLGLRLPGGVDPAALAAALRHDRVHVSVRGTAVRVSVGAHVTDDDVDRFLTALSGAVEASGRAG
jgi:selenocysteine lyase/cysteine desulfurase